MAKTVIIAEKLGKQYARHREVASYRTLRDALSNFIRIPIKQPLDKFWALRDISFELKQGDTLGIIGHNGAGKSTLLKILSRITEPSSGYAKLIGRIGSLLEVGTGFHQELTGRENIYLNGAILGMQRSEIERKFDEIVAFAGVESFIDTPIKHYSSGMVVRLAFSVAAHLEPEILLVDEVLAVGDYTFQQKCLSKMDEVSQQGRTIIFVSHNLAAVQRLCAHTILLEHGNLIDHDQTDQVIKHYLTQLEEKTVDNLLPLWNHDYGLNINACRVELVPESNTAHLNIFLSVFAQNTVSRIGIGFAIYSSLGVKVTSYGAEYSKAIYTLSTGDNHFRLSCTQIADYLTGGDYFVEIWLALPGIGRLVHLEKAGIITIPSTDFFESGRFLESQLNGFVKLPFSVERIKQ